MSGNTAVAAALVGFAYFAALMMVTLEYPRPRRQGRHRRDLPEGAL